MAHAMKAVPIFSVGTWNGLKFEESDLDAMVASFDALGKATKVPLKLGHGRTVPDGQPAMGWVDRIWREGKKLVADFSDVPQLLYEAINKKLYRQVSVELLKDYFRGNQAFPWVLDAVALLGADIPAVKDLPDLKALMTSGELPGARFSVRAAFVAEDPGAPLHVRAEARRAQIRAQLEIAVRERRILPRVREAVLRNPFFKDDAAVLEHWTSEAVANELSAKPDTPKGDVKTMSNKASSMHKGAYDEPRKTIADVLVFRAQTECVRVGGKIDNFDDMQQATERVMRANEKLARAYFSEPNADPAEYGLEAEA